MSLYVPEGFDQRVHRLGLGLEPLDAARRARIASRLDVCLDGVPFPFPPATHPRARDVLERIPRHASCLHALLDRPGLKDPLNVRLGDPSRRYVPRRLSIPFATRPTTIAPFLYPGAAWDTTDAVTALRGRVLRASGEIVRWARVEARLAAATPGMGRRVGLAHGDDRGEYLLLIEPSAATPGALIDPLEIEVTAHGPGDAPVPGGPDLPERDPLWDLPLESVTTPEVLRGEALPSGYTASVHAAHPVPLGRISSFQDLVL